MARTAVIWVQNKGKPGLAAAVAQEAEVAGTYGKVFSLAGENEPVPGCTISGALLPGVTVFSLGTGTDISAERYPRESIQIMLTGRARLEYASGNPGIELVSGDAVIKEAGTDIGVRAESDAVYLEIMSRKEDVMNSAVKAGEVFRLGELVPWREGKIVSMDVMSGPRMKFAVMAFDAGCALPPHAAPGDAIVFALEGEGVIGYGGEEHVIRAGENFRFAKGDLHSVRAENRFKMALLLTIPE